MSSEFEDLEETAWAFGQRVRGKPDDQRAWLVYARALSEIGKDNLAMQALTRVTDLDQFFVESLRSLANLQYKYRMFESARNTALHGLARSTGDIEMLSIAASSSHMLGDYDSALSYYRSGLDIDPENIHLIIGYAGTAISAGQPDLADSLLNRVENQPVLTDQDRSDIAKLRDILQDVSGQ
jgi:tetratricopeptide (TPR) repeat protein